VLAKTAQMMYNGTSFHAIIDSAATAQNSYVNVVGGIIMPEKHPEKIDAQAQKI
jgi:hypothetical protein